MQTQISIQMTQFMGAQETCTFKDKRNEYSDDEFADIDSPDNESANIDSGNDKSAEDEFAVDDTSP